MLVQGLPGVFNTTFTDQSDVSDYRSHCRCHLDLNEQFVGSLRERGINITGRGTWFVSASHTLQDVEDSLEAVREVLLLQEFNRVSLVGAENPPIST